MTVRQGLEDLLHEVWVGLGLGLRVGVGVGLGLGSAPNPNPNPNPIEVCEHALGTRAALLCEADAAQRGDAVARVVAEADEARKERLTRRQHLGSGPVELALTALYLLHAAAPPPRPRPDRPSRAAPNPKPNLTLTLTPTPTLPLTLTLTPSPKP